MNERHDSLQEIISAAFWEAGAGKGDGFDPQACGFAEFCDVRARRVVRATQGYGDLVGSESTQAETDEEIKEVVSRW